MVICLSPPRNSVKKFTGIGDSGTGAALRRDFSRRNCLGHIARTAAGVSDRHEPRNWVNLRRCAPPSALPVLPFPASVVNRSVNGYLSAIFRSTKYRLSRARLRTAIFSPCAASSVCLVVPLPPLLQQRHFEGMMRLGRSPPKFMPLPTNAFRGVS